MAVTSVRAFAAGLLLAACGSGGGFPDARPPDAPTPGGHFSLAWTVTDTNNQPITCDQIGAAQITVLLHNRSVEGGETEVFSCSTGGGTSQGFRPGIYDIRFELGGAIGVIAAGPEQLGVELISGQTTALTPIVFAVQATGNLSLKLESGKAMGNCAPLVGNGAGIATTSIKLVRNSDAMCAPLTLMIAAGATQPATTYTINCTTPVDGPCIDNDQVITAANVSSDSYTIHIKGKNAATTVCWTNDDSISIPPLGMTLMRTLNLAHATTTGC
jgi:hypothetical protein